MSLMINGLTIPTVGVRHCVISFGNDRLLISDVCGNSIFEGYYAEIPTPHGRLIDADALRKTIESIYGGALWTFDCFECIHQAPTIIEAEVSE